MPFRCSMKFRTNAQKKRIDVWLIYRCEGCGETWNLPIFERVAVGDIGLHEFQAIARNDPALAQLYAFDRARLDRHSDHVEESAAVTVRWRVQSARSPQPSEVEISIHLALPWRTRLDRLLAQQRARVVPSFINWKLPGFSRSCRTCAMACAARSPTGNEF